MRPWMIFGAQLCAALAFACRSTEPAATEVHIAAAADLAKAFEEVGPAFTKETGQKAIFSFGSTGLLAKQIEEGAPFDAFAAANLSFAEQVAKSGACDASSLMPYARGRIVLWWRKDAKVAPPATITEAAEPRFAKIAIANPDHAPYGKAAEQAMHSLGIWEKIQARLVFGENVQQTLQFAESGNADLAFIALSLAITSKGAYLPVEERLHPAIDQAMVVCKNGKSKAGGRAFRNFVGSADGRAILRRYGFLLPGEEMAAGPR